MGNYLKILDHYGQPIPRSAMISGYEGATTGRRLSNWGLGIGGPNASLTYSLSSLRSRSRKLAMNEGQVDGGLDTLAANIVGTGITPRWQIKDLGLKAEVQQLWADWVQEADADGVTNFYGLQTLAVRSMIESGEVISRDRFLRLDSGLAVPYQLQLIEADHLDETFQSVEPNTRNEIRMGIEFDSEGKRAAYHLFKEHPSEFFLMADNTIRHRVPASEIRHIYRPLRPGQKRGRPWLASLLLAMHELAKYDDAELVRKVGAAMFGGFITEAAGSGLGNLENFVLGEPLMVDSQNREIVAFEPGTYVPLPAGMDIKFSQPADVGGSYDVFTRRMERKCARGFGGLTYEKFTGDLSNASYSSLRGGNLEAQRIWKGIIYNVVVPQYCQPVAATFLRQAVLTGAIRIRDFATNQRQYLRIKWCIDGWPWTDPVKDMLAEKLAIRNGLKSRAESVAERGRDIEEVDEEIRGDNERADRLGLVLDSDPRQSAMNGVARSQGSQSSQGSNNNAQ